jgi:hypothetical protein
MGKMGKKGIYIYGIINSNSASDLFTPKDSYKKENVYTIPYQDVSAAVSNSEIIDFTYSSKDISAQLLVWHQKVIEKIMSLKYTIIPLRLGTFTVDEAEVKDILSKGYSLIKNIMEKIRDKIETDLVATWADFGSALKEIGEEKEIKKLKEKILANPKRITVNDQMEVGVMIKKALDKKREKYALQIQTFLKRYCTAFKVHELMDDGMVINLACLINIGQQKDFDRKVGEINTKFAEKLNFRSVGPLPPYSFYTLEIKKMQFEEIDWARKLLRLGSRAIKEEIIKAYRNGAKLYHPDKSPDVPSAERRFNEIYRAYRILLEYCQGDFCSFDEREFGQNAVIVRVRE